MNHYDRGSSTSTEFTIRHLMWNSAHIQIRQTNNRHHHHHHLGGRLIIAIKKHCSYGWEKGLPSIRVMFINENQGKQNWHSTPSGSWPPFSGLLDTYFASFTRLVCQTNEENTKNRDSNSEPLGFKSAMLPTEPWRSSENRYEKIVEHHFGRDLY
jgi:hypothetical protein